MGCYLDSAASAKYKESDDIIIDTITDAMRKYWRNPSSLYATTEANEISKCRKIISDFIGAKSDEIIFTSGASESNSISIQGWAISALQETTTLGCKTMPYIITTDIEHKSLLEAVEHSVALFEICEVDKFGIIDYEILENILKRCAFNESPILVSVGVANNEIGVTQDIKRISDLAHKYNGVLHVDATQALTRVPINVEELGIDMMSASGHKISPVLKGVGFLYIRNGIKISPLIHGSQNNGLRGGTYNTFGIIGMAKAIELCNHDWSFDRYVKQYAKLYYFKNLLKRKFNCKFNGHPTQTLPNIISTTFPQNITAESLLYTLDLSDIQISSGSACNSKSIEPSYVLKAIGLSDEEATRTIRFSLPEDITDIDIGNIINEVEKAIKLIES